MYQWKRYLSEDSKSVFIDDEGFLENPEYKYGRNFEKLLPLDRVGQINCSVILGEPGIGKSSLLTEISQNFSNHVVVFKDLKEVLYYENIANDIFNHPDVQRWKISKDQNVPIVFVLDSLDECLIHIEKIVFILVTELSKLSSSNIKLVLSCRPVSWQTLYEKSLKSIFKHSFACLDVLPLRREDIEISCEKLQINHEQLLEEISRLQVGAFASRPVTLNLLLKEFVSSKKLPGSQNEIFQKGCSHLAEEFNESRTAFLKRSLLSLDKRLLLSQRIAYLTIFSNKSIISSASKLETGNEEIHISEFEGDLIIKESHFDFESRHILEVLDSGLFSRKVNDRFQWAHKTYGEYLASEFIIEKKFSIDQLKSLFFIHDANQNLRLNRQLAQVAFFISNVDEVFRKILIQCEPEEFLRSDLLVLSNDQKKMLLETILSNASREGSLLIFENKAKHRLSLLVRPDLIEVVGKFIRHDSGNEALLAVEVLSYADTQEVSEFLFKVVSDPNYNSQVRIDSLDALLKFKSFQKERLRNILHVMDDNRDEIRGLVLTELWPAAINAEEVFQYITKPKKKNYGGSYTFFLSKHLVQKFPETKIAIALEWMLKNYTETKVSSRYGDIFDNIIVRAWESSFFLQDVQVFAAVVVKVFDEHHSLFSRENKGYFEKISSNEIQRRTTYLEILKHFSNAKLKNMLIYGITNHFLRNGDFFWLLDEYSRSNSKKQILDSLFQLLDRSNANQIDALITLIHTEKLEGFSGFIGPIILGSNEEKQAREHWKYSKPRKEKKKSGFPRTRIQNIKTWLDQYPIEPRESFYRLVFELFRGDNEQENVLATWLQLQNILLDSEVIKVLREYISIHEFDLQNILDDKFYNIDVAVRRGFRFLYLTSNLNQNDFEPSFWIKIYPLLLKHQGHLEPDEGEREFISKVITNFSYDSYPNLIAEILFRTQGSYYGLIHDYKNLFDDRTLDLISLKIPEISEVKALDLVADLLRWTKIKDHLLLQSLYGKIFSVPHDKAKSYLQQYLNRFPRHAWNMIFSTFDQTRDLLRSILDSGFSYADKNHLYDALEISELYKLFLELENLEKWSFIDRTDSIDYLQQSKSRLIQAIIDKASFESIKVLKDIKVLFPYLNFIDWSILEAEDKALTHSWIPLQISDLQKISKSNDYQIISNHVDLMNAVIKSLQKFQGYLKGKNPAVKELWNTVQDHVSPKNEIEISSSITRFLKKDLVGKNTIVNCEVEIRPSLLNAEGERTDILIQFISNRAGISKEYSLVIEVKGIWNSGTMNSFEAQLCGRYLKQFDNCSGIYLVVDVVCPEWNRVNDSRRSVAKRNAKSENIEQLRQIAKQKRDSGLQVEFFLLNAKLEY